MTWGQNMKELRNPDKIKYFFTHLDKTKLHLVDEFYHPDVDFTDPVEHLKGPSKIKAYYGQMYENVKTVRFDFHALYESGSTVVAIWKMTLETDKLNGGRPLSVDGNSVITFAENGQAIYHRDYFDMGAFLYENIPGLGFIIRQIKNRMRVE